MTPAGRRLDVLREALLASLTAEASRCEQVFTDDVTYESPILTAASRDQLETLLSSRADALRDVEVAFDTHVVSGDTVVAEWRVAAEQVQPWVVPGDADVGQGARRVTLSGSSVAEFRGPRISSIRHYFDPSTISGTAPSD